MKCRGALLFPGTILAQRSDRDHERPAVEPDQAAVGQSEQAFLIGLYITALSAGAIAASLVSVPLWQATNGSVAVTLGWLAAPAALARFSCG